MARQRHIDSAGSIWYYVALYCNNIGKEETMRRIIVILSLIAAVGISAGQVYSGSTAAPLSTPELKKAVGSGKKTVVFFLNPNGGPCKSQNEVLLQLQKDRKNNFNLV
jgi:thiol-disulfide isomerase/thioredoxin